MTVAAFAMADMKVWDAAVVASVNASPVIEAAEHARSCGDGGRGPHRALRLTLEGMQGAMPGAVNA